MKAHVSQEKKQELKEIKSLLEEYPNFGIIDITNLPSYQLQKIKSKLKETMKVRISKKRLIKIAINDLKDKISNIDKLLPYLENCAPAFLFTKENPFKIAKLLDKNKSSAPAKPDSISPKEIVIPAGPTSFPPGPIIGELGQLGIKATLAEGKVTIKEDKVLLKKGDVINKKTADMLTRFGIEPMEIGLNLVAFYEDSQIYSGEVLSVDEKTYINNIKLAWSQAETLAVSAGYPTKETIKKLIQKSYLETKTLAKSANITTSETVAEQLVDATKAAATIKQQIPEPEEKQEESKKEETQETKPEEKPKEQLEKPEQEKTQEEKPKMAPPVDYTEEKSKEAQEIIEQIKDKAIQK